MFDIIEHVCTCCMQATVSGSGCSSSPKPYIILQKIKQINNEIKGDVKEIVLKDQ